MHSALKRGSEPPLFDNRKIALTYDEAADAMGISVRKLRDLVRHFKMPYVKVGERSIRFLPDDVRAYLAKRRVKEIDVS